MNFEHLGDLTGLFERETADGQFRCRVAYVKGRNTAFINFRACFWEYVKPPDRIFFFEDNGEIYMSFVDPIHLPMYRIVTRRLLRTGRDEEAYKVTLPVQLVRKHNLRQFNTVNLHRLKDYGGLFYRCTFEDDPKRHKKPAITYTPTGEDLPLIDLLN